MTKKQALQELNYMIEFTDIYQAVEDKFLREAECLKFQTPYMLEPIHEGDLIAGMIERAGKGFVGFSPQYRGIYAYYYHDDLAMEALDMIRGEVTGEYADTVMRIHDFWQKEKTIEHLGQRFEDKYGYRIGKDYNCPGFYNADGRLAGTNVDLDSLIRLGLPGLTEKIRTAEKTNGRSTFYEALLITVDTLKGACRYYEQQAIAMSLEADEADKGRLLTMAANLSWIQRHAPATFAQGLQLFWIYAVSSELMNYGRMDVYLGDLYAADLEAGRLDEEGAIEYLMSLYRHFVRLNKVHDTRVIIGGKGRRNEKNADQLAMVIMEVSRRMKEVVPQLTLRYYTGMDERIFDKALEVNAEGCTFPIIYSDDTNIPAVMKGYEVTEEEAEQYLPFGCGEYVLEGLSVGTPNNGVNLLKALELTLHHGMDMYHNCQMGTDPGTLEAFDTFDKLWEAYCSEVDPAAEQLAFHKKFNYDVAGEQAGFLFISLLMNDCIARNQALLSGGVRYLNAASEIFGIISVADSFTAIKKLVYDEKRFTLLQLVSMLDCNFEGFEKERKMLQDAPKYGNDIAEADEMAVKVFHHIAEVTAKAGEKAGLNKYRIVSVNNSMSAEWGTYCMASACGRKNGAPLSNGNGPSIGADKNGITALLNSMSRFDPSLHAGVINNVRFSKEMFASNYDKIKMVLRTFYKNQGVQTNIGAVGKEDLQNAMIHPENYQNLIVRIGGFSARFVELNPIVQNEILLRTTYEE